MKPIQLIAAAVFILGSLYARGDEVSSYMTSLKQLRANLLAGQAVPTSPVLQASNKAELDLVESQLAYLKALSSDDKMDRKGYSLTQVIAADQKKLGDLQNSSVGSDALSTAKAQLALDQKRMENLQHDNPGVDFSKSGSNLQTLGANVQANQAKLAALPDPYGVVGSFSEENSADFNKAKDAGLARYAVMPVSGSSVRPPVNTPALIQPAEIIVSTPIPLKPAEPAPAKEEVVVLDKIVVTANKQPPLMKDGILVKEQEPAPIDQPAAVAVHSSPPRRSSASRPSGGTDMSCYKLDLSAAGDSLSGSKMDDLQRSECVVGSYTVGACKNNPGSSCLKVCERFAWHHYFTDDVSNSEILDVLKSDPSSVPDSMKAATDAAQQGLLEVGEKSDKATLISQLSSKHGFAKTSTWSWSPIEAGTDPDALKKLATALNEILPNSKKLGDPKKSYCDKMKEKSPEVVAEAKKGKDKEIGKTDYLRGLEKYKLADACKSSGHDDVVALKSVNPFYERDDKMIVEGIVDNPGVGGGVVVSYRSWSVLKQLWVEGDMVVRDSPNGLVDANGNSLKLHSIAADSEHKGFCDAIPTPAPASGDGSTSTGGK